LFFNYNHSPIPVHIEFRFLRVLEILALPITFFLGLYIRLFPAICPGDLKFSYKWFIKCNWLDLHFHYYQPVIKDEMLPENYEQIENPLIGIDLDIKNQLGLLNKFHYNAELEAIPLTKTQNLEPYYRNGYFESGDAEILYSIIRNYKPSRIIQIGSGYSTRFILSAVEKNKKESEIETEIICAEPFENRWLDELGIAKKIWSSKKMTNKSFVEQGFILADYNDHLLTGGKHGLGTNVGAEQFSAKVDITKQPILDNINVMYRQRGLEYYKDKDGIEKSRLKEFLTYGVQLQGVDWLGNPIKAHLEFEGRCEEPVKRIQIERDENGREKAEYHLSNIRHMFYIPFTKKTV
jgi:hypothetical protein